MAKAKQDRTVVASKNTLSSLDPMSKNYRTPTLSAYEPTGPFDPLLANEHLKEFSKLIDEKGKTFYGIGDLATSPVADVRDALDTELELRTQGMPTPLTPYMSDEAVGLARFAADFVPGSGKELAEELAINTAIGFNWGDRTVRALDKLVGYLKAKKVNEEGLAAAEEWAKDVNPFDIVDELTFDVEFSPEKISQKAKDTLKWAGEQADAEIAGVYADHDFLSSHFPSYSLVNEDPTKYMGPDSEQFFQSYGAPLVRKVRKQIAIVRDLENNAGVIDPRNLTGEARLAYDEYLNARDELEDTIEMTKQTLYDTFDEVYTDEQVMDYLSNVSGANRFNPDKIYKGVDMTAMERAGLLDEARGSTVAVDFAGDADKWEDVVGEVIDETELYARDIADEFGVDFETNKNDIIRFMRENPDATIDDWRMFFGLD